MLKYDRGQQITLADLDGYRMEDQMAGDFGNGFNKSLVKIIVHHQMHYEVRDHRETILTTDNLGIAIDAYNAIRQRSGETE